MSKISLRKGTWYESAVSGLCYKNPHAAGDISCVVVEGKYFYPKKDDSRCSRCEHPASKHKIDGCCSGYQAKNK